LAVADALDKCRMFVLGCPLIVVVDHKPLLGILNDRSLEGIANPRLLRIKERTLRYQFTIQHNAGKWHRGADAMSRHPTHAAIVSASMLTPHTDMSVTTAAVAALAQAGNDGVVSWDELFTTCAQDPTHPLLLTTIQDGFPTRRQDLPPNIVPYWGVRDRLTTVDGVALMDLRPVIPPALRSRVLAALHSAHQGMAGMKARARLSVYWPGLDKSLRNYLDTCHYCRIHAPSQPREPLLLAPSPSWPYDQVAVDYFDFAGKCYLVFVDRFSSNIHIFHFPPGRSTARHLISSCRSIFLQYGAPRELASDGGRQFVSQEFQDFLAHCLSPPQLRILPTVQWPGRVGSEDSQTHYR